jgi:hypothetical protein
MQTLPIERWEVSVSSSPAAWEFVANVMHGIQDAAAQRKLKKFPHNAIVIVEVTNG